jgi:uncharacterized protein YwlG (UPF0340 family)
MRLLKNNFHKSTINYAMQRCQHLPGALSINRRKNMNHVTCAGSVLQ